MKKEKQKKTSGLAVLYYIVAGVFYFIAILHFLTGADMGMGVIWMGLGTGVLGLAYNARGKKGCGSIGEDLQ